MTLYRTQNSVWEVDWECEAGARVRRLSGLAARTDRTPEDGTWRRAEAVVDLPGDQGLLITWEGVESTWTSVILERSD